MKRSRYALWEVLAGIVIRTQKVTQSNNSISHTQWASSIHHGLAKTRRIETMMVISDMCFRVGILHAFFQGY